MHTTYIRLIKAQDRAQRLHRAAIKLSTEQCVSMTAEVPAAHGVDVNHKSSENIETFQTKLLRSTTFMAFHFYSDFGSSKTSMSLLEIQGSTFTTTNPSNNLETKLVKDYGLVRNEPRADRLNEKKTCHFVISNAN